MKIALLILLASCYVIVNCEYPRTPEHPRFKNRAPPYPPRPPPMPMYMKKWQQPPMFPKRMPMPPPNRPQSRPIPLHMPQGPKPPPQQMAAQSQHRPNIVAPPMRNFYKNQNVQGPPNNVKFAATPEKQHYIQKEKPQFLSSLPIPATQDYEYHIQANSIPTHTTPIKQVGEKGPIHTIPAPNLSLKDKPIVVEEIRKQQEFRYQQHHQENQQNLHQYQVTEPNEPLPNSAKIFGTQQVEIQPQQLYYVPEQQPQALALQGQQNELSFRVIPQQQTQAIQTTFIQQQPQANYQLLNQQLFQAEPIFVQDVHHNQEASDKVSVEPEYHSFNYDEQAHQKQQALSKAEISGLVQAAYNLAEQENRGSSDALAQTQMVQSYFDTRDDKKENAVEPDARPSASEDLEEEKEEMVDGSSPGFASLPNKDVAERLAQLQAAGKINNRLMKIPPKQILESKNPISIYVPEEEDGSKEEDQSLEYSEDYSQEADDRRSSEENFGHRLNPKQN